MWPWKRSGSELRWSLPLVGAPRNCWTSAAADGLLTSRTPTQLNVVLQVLANPTCKSRAAERGPQFIASRFGMDRMIWQLPCSFMDWWSGRIGRCGEAVGRRYLRRELPGKQSIDRVEDSIPTARIPLQLGAKVARGGQVDRCLARAGSQAAQQRQQERGSDSWPNTREVGW